MNCYWFHQALNIIELGLLNCTYLDTYNHDLLNYLGLVNTVYCNNITSSMINVT